MILTLRQAAVVAQILERAQVPNAESKVAQGQAQARIEEQLKRLAPQAE